MAEPSIPPPPLNPRKPSPPTPTTLLLPLTLSSYSIDHFPVEILLNFFIHLRLRDVLAIAATCKRLNEVCSSDLVYHSLPQFTEANSVLLRFTRHVPSLEIKLKPRRILRGHIGKVYAFDWNRKDPTKMVSLGSDARLISYDADTNRVTNVTQLRSQWNMSVALSPNARLVALAGLDQQIYVYTYPLTPNTTPTTLEGHEGYISCCKFVDNSRLLTSSGDVTIKLWDIETNRCITTFVSHKGDVMSVCMSPTMQDVFVSGSCDLSVKLWDTRSPQAMASYLSHKDDVNTVNFCSNGYMVGSGSDDESCKLYDIRTGPAQLMHLYDGKLECVRSIDFSVSGRLLFAGYSSHVCRVWDTLKAEPVYDLKGHTSFVSEVATSPDGTAVCTASWDETLRIWA